MFEEKIHLLRLHRALRRFDNGNDFLMRHSVDDIVDRLGIVSQTFNEGAVLFERTNQASDPLINSGKVTHITRIEEEWCMDPAHHTATPTLLNLDETSLDLVIAPLTLHWSNDLPGTLIQINRSLRPNGLFLASLPGPDTLFELRQSLLEAESEMTDGAANRVDSFTDIRDAGSLLQRAGFSLPVVDQENLTVRYDSVFDLIRDLRGFGATLHLEGVSNPPLTRSIVMRMAEIYAQKFADPDGRIRATFSFTSLSGWKPHESQQKPLKPGSAKGRLADALKTEEIKLKG